jgi:hypothetical protein
VMINFKTNCIKVLCLQDSKPIGKWMRPMAMCQGMPLWNHTLVTRRAIVDLG